jgi:hypothetical protein
VVIADTVGRKEAGFKAVGELAELLAAPVLDQFGRFNFPVLNPLNLTGQNDKVIPQADLILALDVPDLEGATTKRAQDEAPKSTPFPANKIINVARHLWCALGDGLQQAARMIDDRRTRRCFAGACAPSEAKNWSSSAAISPSGARTGEDLPDKKVPKRNKTNDESRSR